MATLLLQGHAAQAMKNVWRQEEEEKKSSEIITQAPLKLHLLALPSPSQDTQENLAASLEEEITTLEKLGKSILYFSQDDERNMEKLFFPMKFLEELERKKEFFESHMLQYLEGSQQVLKIYLGGMYQTTSALNKLLTTPKTKKRYQHYLVKKAHDIFIKKYYDKFFKKNK